MHANKSGQILPARKQTGIHNVQPRVQPNELLFRHARSADIPQLQTIENASFHVAWDYDDFVRNIHPPQRPCLVVELCGQIVGFMVWDMLPDQIRLMNFAVLPEFRRRGVGTAMVDKLKGALDGKHRAVLHLMISEKNLPGQLFWKAVGFRCTALIPNAFGTMDEDGYLMCYSVLWKY